MDSDSLFKIPAAADYNGQIPFTPGTQLLCICGLETKEKVERLTAPQRRLQWAHSNDIHRDL
jgi:hypothetical protein